MTPLVTDIDAELPFSARILLRQRVLSWISDDVGLAAFLLPSELTEAWSEEQRKEWIDTTLSSLFPSEVPSAASASIQVHMADRAAVLRRVTRKLLRGTADHKAVTLASDTLESLWNTASPQLEDATWARCVMLFDTAMVSLRVAYLWLHMKTEAPIASTALDVRKEEFKKLIDSFFNPSSDNDEHVAKQSDNFRKLLSVWKGELDSYTQGDDFEDKLLKLEESQTLPETANCIHKFLIKVIPEPNWVMKMHTIDKEIGEGMWNRRKTKPKPKTTEPPSNPNLRNAHEEESGSSFEPKEDDSDFDFDEAAKDKAEEKRQIEDEGFEDEFQVRRGVASRSMNDEKPTVLRETRRRKAPSSKHYIRESRDHRVRASQRVAHRRGGNAAPMRRDESGQESDQEIQHDLNSAVDSDKPTSPRSRARRSRPSNLSASQVKSRKRRRESVFDDDNDEDQEQQGNVKQAPETAEHVHKDEMEVEIEDDEADVVDTVEQDAGSPGSRDVDQQGRKRVIKDPFRGVRKNIVRQVAGGSVANGQGRKLRSHSAAEGDQEPGNNDEPVAQDNAKAAVKRQKVTRS